MGSRGLQQLKKTPTYYDILEVLPDATRERSSGLTAFSATSTTRITAAHTR